MFKEWGGGVKGFLNNVQKAALFLQDGFPYGRSGSGVLHQSDYKQMVPFTDEERQYLTDHQRGKRWGGVLFSSCPQIFAIDQNQPYHNTANAKKVVSK